jgi:hypothetical protein
VEYWKNGKQEFGKDLRRRDQKKRERSNHESTKMGKHEKEKI